MNRLTCLLALAAAFILAPALAARPASPEGQPDAKAIEAQIRRIADQLHPVTGDIRIATANAVLHLREDYYFLPADEARLVLTEAWGNPPEASQGVLGMVFPAGRTFADDTWGAVITYEDSGYVSDEDAESTDYAALLTELQTAVAAGNEARRQAGFPTEQLIGWAQAPAYDAATHSLVWARNIRFEGTPENTLNYDVRLLGRRGVLSLNLVTVMSKLAETRTAAAGFARSVEFEAGARYADFQPGTDRVAEYGVAGLVAAGAGVAVAKKVGLLAVILGFGKKIIIFLIAGIALGWRWIRRLWARDEEQEAMAYYDEAPAEYAAEGPPLDSAAPDGPPADAPPERQG